jgi:tight adherence protein C
MFHQPLSSAIVVFVLGMTSVFGLCMALFGGHRARFDRLAEPRKNTGSGSVLSRNSVVLEGVAGRLLGWQVRRIRGQQGSKLKSQRLQSVLSDAGFRGTDKIVIFRALQFLAVGAIGSAAAMAGFALGRLALLLGISGVAAGYLIPEYLLRRLGRKRKTQITRELPAALDLLVVCLEAGVGLTHSLKLVARECEQHGRVFGGELATSVAEIAAGISLEDSLHNLGERTGVDDIKSLAALVIQSNQMGTRLGPALRSSAELLVSRRRMRAEEHAQKSAIKMLIPLVLLILPAMMIVILGPAVIQIIGILTS